MAPSPLFQLINRTLHTEPLATIFHTAFWSFVLFIGCPLAGIILLLSAPLRIIYAYFNDLRKIDSYKEGIEYGVVVTGCDCGFGKDVVFELSNRGFVVFAGCRCLDDCKGQFEGKFSAEWIMISTCTSKHAKDYKLNGVCLGHMLSRSKQYHTSPNGCNKSKGSI
jgi:hypothetical protein